MWILTTVAMTPHIIKLPPANIAKGTSLASFDKSPAKDVRFATVSSQKWVTIKHRVNPIRDFGVWQNLLSLAFLQLPGQDIPEGTAYEHF